MNAVVEVLQAAVGTGEIVEIVYFGGTQPGTRRDITVRAVNETYVAAMCLATRRPKNYRLDLIELPEPGSSYALYVAGSLKVQPPAPASEPDAWIRVTFGAPPVTKARPVNEPMSRSRSRLWGIGLWIMIWLAVLAWARLCFVPLR